VKQSISITTTTKSSPATRHGGAWGERRYSSYSFSTSALDGGEWSASRPGRAFTPGERTPGTHCTGGWVGPRAGLDTEVRGEIDGLSPRRPGFAPGSIHVGFVADKVAQGQVFLRVLRFSPVNFIPPSLSKLISSGECVIC
jgi:hypothetical protein